MISYWLLPIFSALILAASFEWSSLGLLSLIGIIPLLVFIEKISEQSEYSLCFWQKKSVRVFLGGWIVGFIFFALTTRWLLFTFSFNWADIPSGTSVAPVVGFVWLLISFILGISFGIFAFLTFKLRTKTISDIVVISSIWILAECLKAQIFMLISWGPGGTLAPHWSMGNIGYALVDAPFIFWSRFAGIYGVSFLAALTNVAIFLFLGSAYPFLKKLKIIVISSVIFCSLLFLPIWLSSVQPEKNSLRIALLQTNSRFGFLNPQALAALWEKSKKTSGNFIQPDIVVFPENSRLLASDSDENKLLFRRLFPDENKPGLIVTSIIETDPNSLCAPKEKIIYRNQKGELVDVQEKNFLIPAGEFLPIAVKTFVEINGDNIITERFAENRILSPGNTPEHPVSFASIKIGTLLCSGVLSSSLYRSLTKEGAEILINSASLTIFNANPLFFSQMKNMARFQAIANTRPFLQSANGGPTFYINENGKIIAEAISPDAQFIFTDVAPIKIKTIFTELGDWPLVAALVILVIASSKGLWFRKK